MKKILFASAFALFGSFAMANETEETKEIRKEETKTETIVDVFGCAVTLYTNIYDSCGSKIDGYSSSYWSDDKNCEGVLIKIESHYSTAPCIAVDEIPHPGK